MAQVYSNTGYARMKTLTVRRGSDSSTYTITNQFVYDGSTYTAITDEQFARMSSEDYNARLTAFAHYVYGLNDGLQENCPDITDGADVYNVDWCPLSGPFPEYEWVHVNDNN